MIASISAEPNPVWRAYFLLLLVIGKRRGELLAARWSQVDLDEREPALILTETKAGKPDVVVLPPTAVEILEMLPRQDDAEFIFPGVGKTGHLTEPKRA